MLFAQLVGGSPSPTMSRRSVSHSTAAACFSFPRRRYLRALLAAYFGAVPLADLPRPETWALMPRHVDASPGGLLRLADYFGTALFAQAGVIQAGTRGMDFLGCVIVGAITAMGGGTFRGFVLGERPVFWAAEPEYLYISVIASMLTFFVWPHVERRIKDKEGLEVTLNWMDALSIGAFCVIGANNGLRGANGNPLVGIVCGVFTASFGGIIRDTLCAMPARILHSHQDAYASITSMGASAYVALSALQAPVAARIAVPVALVVFVRWIAWTKGLRLPVYRP